MIFPDLTEPERAVCAAFPRGEWVDLREPGEAGTAGCWGPQREIRAQVLQALLLGAGEAEPGFAPAIRLRGAWITGRLDLLGATVRWPLVCEYCEFESGIRFVEATTRTVRITDSRMPAFNGTRMRLDGILSLWGCAIRGVLRLDQAKVTGQVCLRGAVAGLAGGGGEAVAASDLTVDGGVECAEMTCHGGVSLRGARISGTVDLRRARISRPGAVAFDADNAEIGGRLYGPGLVAEGATSLHNARIGASMVLTGARLDAGDGDVALAADNAAIDGRLVLSDVRARGEVSLRNAHVGRAVLATGAMLEAPGGIALRLSGASVTGDVNCCGMAATGGVRATGARIGGRFDLSRVTLAGGDATTGEAGEPGEALSARALQAGQLILRPAAPVRGLVDLGHARVEVLQDDAGQWPEQLAVDGLAYQMLEPRLPARARLAWLTRDPGGHQPQPYEQLAAHYTSIGEPGQARAVLLARERRQRRSLTLLPRTWGVLQDLILGYGYQPWRAVAWLAVLLAAGTLLFTVSPPRALAAGAPPFHAFVYTLDLLLPVADLGLKHAYSPAGPAQWFAYLLVAAGWVLVTTVAAAAARVLSRR